MFTTPIDTARLQVRRFAEEDWPEVHSYTSLPHIMEYLEEDVMTEAETQAFVREHMKEEGTAYPVILKAQNRLIGHIFYRLWFAPRTYELGWVLHPDHHRRGYASEAALALLRYGFEEMNLHRIIATCQPENVASWGVMEKIGMRREGHFQKCIHRGGDTWWSEYFYAMLAEEWKQKEK